VSRRALLQFERKARAQGFKQVAGIDEAGRGPLAGPVVAAACLLPHNLFFPEVNDSKQLTTKKREELFQILTTHPQIRYGVGIVCHETIDRINIARAAEQAMLVACSKLDPQPDLLLVDGLPLPHPSLTVWNIIKGDMLSHSIAAASIIAKVIRDSLMDEYHEQWPEYGFKSHKGYGTAKHLAALKEHGPCPIHRKSYAPVAAVER
jgi:ribonuclease HII